MDSHCTVNESGKHIGRKVAQSWECTTCGKTDLVAPCLVGSIDHAGANMLICVLCDHVMIKCDFCSVTEIRDGKIPEGWLSCRLRNEPVEGEINSIVKGPTACPFHREQLKLVLAASNPRDIEVDLSHAVQDFNMSAAG